MACNPLLKNAERKTRQFVGSPKDSKGAAAKAGAGGAPRPGGALAPWDHHPQGYGESSPSPAAVSFSPGGPCSLGARPRVNLEFLTSASAVARKRPAGHPCQGPFRSYTKACNYIWIGSK